MKILMRIQARFRTIVGQGFRPKIDFFLDAVSALLNFDIIIFYGSTRITSEMNLFLAATQWIKAKVDKIMKICRICD